RKGHRGTAHRHPTRQRNTDHMTKTPNYRAIPYSARRHTRRLDMPRGATDVTGLLTLPPMIEIRDVTKSYGDFRALDGCTATVASGTVVVICGPSGSGKSTLIRCINRLECIDAGDILVDGVSVCAPGTDLSMMRARIGMV